MKKFPFACLLLLAPSSFAGNSGSIRFLSIDGDPLIAGKDQNLTFSFAHYGAAYSTFEFVFELKKDGETLYRKSVSFFKAEDGLESVGFLLPAKYLIKGETLLFEARLEHASPSPWGNGYICYQKQNIRQTPKETGGLFMPQDFESIYSFQGHYYPHLGAETGRYSFYGVKRDQDGAGSRLGLSDIYLLPQNIPEKAILSENVGELRIYNNLERWKIGERKKKFVAVPLSFQKDGNYYRLALAQNYSISKSDGTLFQNDGGEIKDLIFPSWSVGLKLHFAICLNAFSKGGETVLFYRDLTPDYSSLTASDAYQIYWEEL